MAQSALQRPVADGSCNLPVGYKGTMEWNGPYFKRKAAAVGPYTEEVITHFLSSRKYEVRTYRQCIGRRQPCSTANGTMFSGQAGTRSAANILCRERLLT